jgi:tRNA/tmRNA/rRNA uracil-C5-methylase (TrmA/RlmC/RlmD family)
MDYNKTLLVKQELIINSLSKYFDDKCLINSITPCKNTKNYLKKYKLDFNKNYKEKSYFSNIINKLSLLFIKFRNESKIIPKNFWDSILFREVNNNIMIKINLLLNDQDIEYVWNVEIEDLCSKINNLLKENKYKLILLKYEFINLNKQYIYEGNEYYKYNLNFQEKNIELYLTIDSFFGGNYDILLDMYNIIYSELKNLKYKNIIIMGNESANISILLNDIFEEIYCIINNKSSYDCGLKTINNISNIFLKIGKDNLEKIFSNNKFNILCFTNNNGLNDEEIEIINNSKIKYILYITSNIKKLINDLIKLKKYKIRSIKTIDEYPFIIKRFKTIVLLKI